jgi:phosphatidylglycerol:prolipoprotein diacylglycerol transferase
MLPYFQQPSLDLGLFEVHAFGVMVLLGILIGGYVLRRRSRTMGLEPARADRLLGWILIGGFLGAHLVDRLVYFPARTFADPVSLLRVWDGLSSFGGFLGAAVGALAWAWRGHAAGRTWSHLDAVAYAFPIGWFFGRMGCFLAFDHPGLPTRFALGQSYVDGVVRHNLGLEEALLMIPLAAAMALAGRRDHQPGYLVGLLATLYAPVRFLLDFLRANDTRYLGMTPGQYGAIAVLLAGLTLLWRASARHGDRQVRLGYAG